MGDQRDFRGKLDGMIQDGVQTGRLGMGDKTDRDKARQEALGGSLIDDADRGMASIDARIRLIEKEKANNIELGKLDYVDGKLDGQLAGGTQDQQVAFNASTIAKQRFNEAFEDISEESKARTEALINLGRGASDPLTEMGYSGLGSAAQSGFIQGPNGQMMAIPPEVLEMMKSDDVKASATSDAKKIIDEQLNQQKSIRKQMEEINTQLATATDEKTRNDLKARATTLGNQYQQISKDIQKTMDPESDAEAKAFKFDLDNQKDVREFVQKWLADEHKYSFDTRKSTREWYEKEISKVNDSKRKTQEKLNTMLIGLAKNAGNAEIKHDMIPTMQRDNFVADAVTGWSLSHFFGSGIQRFLPARLFNQTMKWNKQASGGQGGGKNFNPMGTIIGK